MWRSVGSQSASRCSSWISNYLVETFRDVFKTVRYAICGDQKLRRIALTRPSTRARLANIDGVNQHFLNSHGDCWLRSIRHLSKHLNLAFDREPNAPSPTPRKVCTVPNNKRVSPAKFEAWKMWQVDGYTFHKIANFPSRAAPIKEQTVIEYLLEAARKGCTIAWTRFCEEIGLTHQIFMNIQDVVSKVGIEKLKPFKTELPEEVTYSQIKSCLVMQEMGISTEFISSGHHQDCGVEGQANGESLVDNVNGGSSLGKSEVIVSDVLIGSANTEQSVCGTDGSPNSRKRQKIDGAQAGQSAAVEATQFHIMLA